MLKQKNGNHYLLPVILTFFLASIFLNKMTKVQDIFVSKQDSATNLNRDFLKFTSVGNKRLIADLIWIKTLLDSDYEKYEKKDFNNWMYHRFKTIAELDPPFYENYLWGGMYLSIIKNDLEGAADIYELGLKKFSTDYRLIYNAGFNYYFEMGKFKEGLNLLEKIENNPQSPKTLKSIIYKLRFETHGDYDAALDYLRLTIISSKDEVITNKLKKDLYSLKAERDLNCLNQNHLNCDTKDALGDPYVFKNNRWVSTRDYVPYKIFLKNSR